MALVHTESLCRRFGRRWAYARVDLQVEKGQKWLLFGSNGSGKTTLLRTIATLLPPTDGVLEMFGSSEIDEARRRVGYLGHHAGVYEDLSGAENIAFTAHLLGKETGDIEGRLKRVGLSPRDAPVRTYSAGMRKRLSWALLLLKQPDLVLLDEPFSALDPAGVENLCQDIDEMDATFIIASHQVERASELCTHALLLSDGIPRWTGLASDAWKAWRAVQRERP